jgi:glycosyltransferase involved in cell wall biosynthesis
MTAGHAQEVEQGATERAARRVLMICYYFPPIHAVGANRSVGFASHLTGLGWIPTVLSVTKSRIPWERSGAPLPAGIEIVRSPEWNLHPFVEMADEASNRVFRAFGARRAPRILRSSFWIPDPQIAWRFFSAAVRLARQADCIYVSCSPFSAAVTAAFVAKRTRKPLVLDFRDPWGGYGLPPRLQRWAISRADRLILNTPRALAAYARVYPHLAARMLAIPNGFDTLPDASSAVPPTDTFTVMHVGEFYGSRQPDTLLEVLAELNLPDAEFVQVGSEPEAFARFRTRVRIRHIQSVPRDEAISLMQAASLLYLRIHHEERFAAMTVPAKTYEYLSTGVPILAECQDGAASDLVRDYGINSDLVSPGNSADIKAAVLRAYHRRHEPSRRVNPRFAERFDRRVLTSQLAAAMEAAVAGPSPGQADPPGRRAHPAEGA